MYEKKYDVLDYELIDGDLVIRFNAEIQEVCYGRIMQEVFY